MSGGPLGNGPEDEDDAPEGNGSMENGDTEPEEDDEQIKITKLGTGIHVLDQRLDGGLPPGSVVSIVADPKSTAELFLYDLATTRKTHYFTTMRSPESVRASLDILDTEPADLEIVDLSGRLAGATDVVMDHLENVEPDENIVVDTFSDLAVRTDRFEELLDALYETSHANGNITYLYMLESADAALSYDERKVPYLSDVVMKMRQDVSGEKVENRLAITKLRGETPPPKTIKLNIGTSVEIDTSRDIA